ncbi:P-loop containing nucleoside triphosphate hydrolase superfamily protein [Zea mays]|uniref:p-loop containing nucleoside triphosphate hydrolase superfamily protein n=1 Tax=Zea mays TaxID=4577 RepID=A0A1D6FH03_MAIZE|nr:P-loop containing nucleoside triphosphate hydrolase superfamily protein [Zea mays]
MEAKSVVMSALGIGIGVGVGLGLASAPWAAGASASSRAAGVTVDRVEQDLRRLLVDGADTKVTFDEFPYYLSEQTRVVLTSAAYVHLKQADISKYTRNLAPASRTILLSGPAELYQQMLARALAHYFQAKLLLLDPTDFLIKIHSKYGTGGSTEKTVKRSISETTLERVSGLLGSLSILPQKEQPKGTIRRQSSMMDVKLRSSESMSNLTKLRRNASTSSDMSSMASQGPSTSTAPLRRSSSWTFDEKILVQALYKVLLSVSKKYPVVLYIRDVEKFLHKSPKMYLLFEKLLNKLEGPVLILGSRIVDMNSDEESDDRLTVLFPYNIEIKPPENENHLVSWNSQLEEDMKMIQFQDNRNHIMEVLAENDLECDDLGSICLSDTMCLSKYIEEIVVSAVSYHLMNNKDPEYRNGKLVLSTKSLSHALEIFQGNKISDKDSMKLEATDDALKAAEKATAPTTAKSETKSATSLPPARAPAAAAAAPASAPAPRIESKTELEKKDNPPPVAKAPEVTPDNEFEKRIRPEVIPANEIGVSFDDIGALDDIKESLQELVMLPLRRPDLFKGGLLKPCRDEKNVRALFTLAAKVSPTIIFVDEVDSMLGQRNRAGEHEAMRKIKNEFMTHWDGLLSRPDQRILVLAATNRPFDLDEAIIRRFERRIMVGLPSMGSRELIMRRLLSKEKVDEGLDFKELATMTEGYSGSDLKNLCTTAAYRPVRELIQKERKKELEKLKCEKGETPSDPPKKEKEETIILRPLNMTDLKEAKNQVAASFAAEGAIMSELRQWNELYGEGGSRKKQQLTYFL